MSLSLIVILVTNGCTGLATALVTYYLTIRYLTVVPTVEGDLALTIKPRTERPAPSTLVFWVLVVASTVLVAVAGMAYVSLTHALEDIRENSERNDQQDCDDAYLWLGILYAARDHQAPPPTERERETRQKFKAQQLATIENLDCKPPPTEPVTP